MSVCHVQINIFYLRHIDEIEKEGTMVNSDNLIHHHTSRFVDNLKNLEINRSRSSLSL